MLLLFVYWIFFRWSAFVYLFTLSKREESYLFGFELCRFLLLNFPNLSTTSHVSSLPKKTKKGPPMFLIFWCVLFIYFMIVLFNMRFLVWRITIYKFQSNNELIFTKKKTTNGSDFLFHHLHKNMKLTKFYIDLWSYSIIWETGEQEHSSGI